MVIRRSSCSQNRSLDSQQIVNRQLVIWRSSDSHLTKILHALSFYRSQNVLCWQKNQFYLMQIIFLYSPKYVNRFLVWHKKFGPFQNFLGPVKGQGDNHQSHQCSGYQFQSHHYQCYVLLRLVFEIILSITFFFFWTSR